MKNTKQTMFEIEELLARLRRSLPLTPLEMRGFSMFEKELYDLIEDYRDAKGPDALKEMFGGGEDGY